MTIFGWDASSYDGHITSTIAGKAKSEGIRFATHRLLRQGNLLDSYAAGNLAALRDAGIEFLGTYGVVSSGEGQSDADRLVSMANQKVPWWRDFPGWFWQVDLERWENDSVPPTDGIACARRIRDRTDRLVVLYASHGQYGDQLKAWDGPLWNADYTSHSAAGFAAMYPGDNWAPLHGGTWHGGWTPYSGKAPTFLQYTSSATIAGLSTCDANAFRGTLAQLRALVSPTQEEDVNEAQDHALAETWAATVALRSGSTAPMTDTKPAGAVWAVEQLKSLGAAQTQLLANMQQLAGRDFVNEQAIVDGVLAGLGTRDVDAIVDALRAVLSPEKLAAVKAAL